jgi:hypothetical protein
MGKPINYIKKRKTYQEIKNKYREKKLLDKGNVG